MNTTIVAIKMGIQLINVFFFFFFFDPPGFSTNYFIEKKEYNFNL